MKFYESETHMISDTPTTVFVEVPYKIVTEESERIAVDHVAHLKETLEGSSKRKCCQQRPPINVLKYFHYHFAKFHRCIILPLCFLRVGFVFFVRSLHADSF